MVGKGGAGKTALSALLVRALRDFGRKVLAVDLDRSPGLAVSLGLPIMDLPLPDTAVQAKAGADYGWAMADGLTADEAMWRYSLEVEPGLRFLGIGNIGRAHHGLERFATAIQQLWNGFDDREWIGVADMEAGPTTTFEGYVRCADVCLVVARATPVSTLAAQRLSTILQVDGTPLRMVATAVRGDTDIDFVSEALGPPFAVIPFDPDLRHLEQHGSLWALPRSSPASAAIAELAHLLLAETPRPLAALTAPTKPTEGKT